MSVPDLDLSITLYKQFIIFYLQRKPAFILIGLAGCFIPLPSPVLRVSPGKVLDHLAF